ARDCLVALGLLRPCRDVLSLARPWPGQVFVQGFGSSPLSMIRPPGPFEVAAERSTHGEDWLKCYGCSDPGPTVGGDRGRNPRAVVLLDTPGAAKGNRDFLARFRAEQVIPVGPFSDGTAEPQRRLGTETASGVEWKPGQSLSLWEALFPRFEGVVVCPAEPRRLLL